MQLSDGLLITIFLLFIVALMLYSAVQTALVNLQRGASVLLITRTQSMWKRLYKLSDENSSLFFITSAVGFWVFLLWYAAWFNGQLLYLLHGTYAAYLFVLYNIIFFSMIFLLGVLLPVLLAKRYPSHTWSIVFFPFLLISILFFPVAWLIHFLSRRSVFSAGEAFVFRSLQLSPAIAELNANAVAQANLIGLDQEIYHNAMEFNTLRVRDCMLPRTEIIAVEKTEGLEVVKQHFINSGHSKLVVYRENIDNVIGYIHLIDMYRKPSGIDKILMPITIAPESMTAGELLKQLIDRRRSMAVVVDEFGGTSGLITIEDLIEEIIGDIEDEYDVDDSTEKRISETEFIFSARLEIDYLNENYGLNLPEGDYDTLGGLISLVHQNIPKAREVVSMPPFEFTILSTAQARILDVKVKIGS
ncbi:MAG: hemolysin family protein [Bacteroidia bacterium]